MVEVEIIQQLHELDLGEGAVADVFRKIQDGIAVLLSIERSHVALLWLRGAPYAEPCYSRRTTPTAYYVARSRPHVLDHAATVYVKSPVAARPYCRTLILLLQGALASRLIGLDDACGHSVTRFHLMRADRGGGVLVPTATPARVPAARPRRVSALVAVCVLPPA